MKLDRISSIVLFLVGGVVTREGSQMAYMSDHSPGPGFFPLWLGIVLMALSAILFVTTKSPSKPFIENMQGFQKAALVAVSFLVYVFALSYLGLLVALGLFLAFTVGWVEHRSRWTWIAVALLGSLGHYLLFEVWLGVPLPIGLLGI